MLGTANWRMTETRTLLPVTSRIPATGHFGPPIRVRLPAGGWQVGFRVQRDGRTVVEVTDPDGTLAGLVASSRLPILSIDAGWRGCTRDPAGDRRWWVLAIGHVPAEAGQPSVTFTRRGSGIPRGRRPSAALPRAVEGLWVARDGLWVAAAAGHYSLVRLTAQSTTHLQRLQPVPENTAASPVAGQPHRCEVRADGSGAGSGDRSLSALALRQDVALVSFRQSQVLGQPRPGHAVRGARDVLRAPAARMCPPSGPPPAPMSMRWPAAARLNSQNTSTKQRTLLGTTGQPHHLRRRLRSTRRSHEHHTAHRRPETRTSPGPHCPIEIFQPAP